MDGRGAVKGLATWTFLDVEAGATVNSFDSDTLRKI